jgi:hypothetical protein
VLLFELSEESKSKGIFKSIAISSFNSLLREMYFSGSKTVDKSIFHKSSQIKIVESALSIHQIESFIKLCIFSICSSVRLSDLLNNIVGFIFQFLKNFLKYFVM